VSSDASLSSSSALASLHESLKAVVFAIRHNIALAFCGEMYVINVVNGLGFRFFP
jgi:hypothetical protein